MSRLRCARAVTMWSFATVIFILANGCSASLSETVLGTWKGHLTAKSKHFLRKQAATFTFSKKGSVDIVLDDGSREINTYEVVENRCIQFTEAGQEKPAIEWSPILSDDVLDGPVKSLEDTRRPKLLLRLKRVSQ